MVRTIAITAIGSILLGCLPAQAQDMPELDGAPGPLKVPKAAPVQPKPVPAQPRTLTPKPAPAKIVQPKPAAPLPARPSATAAQLAAQSAAQLKATEDRLAKQAEAQAASAALLARQAADLKSREAALDARATDLALAERRLADQRLQQEASLSAKQAELDRKLAAAARPASDRQVATRAEDPPVPSLAALPGRGNRAAGVDLAAATRSCAFEAQAEARARAFFSASYDGEPRLNTRTMELRGLMRLNDRRGYRLVDTVCELTPEGEAEYFEFLR